MSRANGRARWCRRGAATPPGFWRCLRVEATAFRARKRRDGIAGPARGLAGLAAIALALWAYERRASPNGRAVCLLGPRWPRLVAGGLGAILAAGVVGALCPVAAYLVVASISACLFPVVVRAVRAVPAGRSLPAMAPLGPHLYLHSLASTAPGAGAELVQLVSRETDAAGRALVLDAGNEKLLHYYEALGFRALGPWAPMPKGEARVRMWRPVGGPPDRP